MLVAGVHELCDGFIDFVRHVYFALLPLVKIREAFWPLVATQRGWSSPAFPRATCRAARWCHMDKGCFGNESVDLLDVFWVCQVSVEDWYSWDVFIANPIDGPDVPSQAREGYTDTCMSTANLDC